MKAVILVGLGGFTGSVLRYWAGMAAKKYITAAFPAGTFLVNVPGCFAIGPVLYFFKKETLADIAWKLFLAVGFCGGFTTLSSFAVENPAAYPAGQYCTVFILYLAQCLIRPCYGMIRL